jgi:hypothetical protein
MNERSDSIVLAEQQVAEARTAALAEYEAVRAKLRRRLASPVFIGGVVLGVIALGYLARGRGEPKRPACPERPGAWSRALKAVQVLLPLIMALSSATKSARRSDANIGGTAS